MGCRILIIGYSGFREYQWNPAEAVAEKLRGRRIAGCIVESHVVPVSFSMVRKVIPRLLESVDPAVALGVGLAPSAKSVLLELAAANYAYFEVGDEDGFKSSGEEVVTGGPMVVHTTLPVGAILGKCWEEKGLAIEAKRHHRHLSMRHARLHTHEVGFREWEASWLHTHTSRH